jgi:tRNA G37 N-methylase Trm5
MKNDAAVLDLCSGDGFYSCHFYSVKAKKIIALDFDETAVEHAKKYNKAPKIEYLLSDIRISIPKENLIIYSGMLELPIYTTDEMKFILNVVKNRLSDDGILSGYTIVENESGMKSLKQHNI